MDGTDIIPVRRDANGRFTPGGGTGRRFGSRNRLSKRVARSILRDFETNQGELLPRARRWFLPQYLTLISRLMPKLAEEGGPNLDLPGDGAEAAAMIAEVRQALARIDAGEGSAADLEAALLGERHNSGAINNGDLW